MAEFSFQDLLNSAAEAPEVKGNGDPLEVGGKYRAEVVFGNYKMTANGKLQVGIKYAVQGGAQDGKTIWANQTLSPESPAALDIFFRTFEALGIERAKWAQFGTNIEAAGAAVADKIVGAVVDITVAMGKAQNGYAARLEVKRVSAPSSTAPVAAVAAAAPAIGVPSIPAQGLPSFPGAPARPAF